MRPESHASKEELSRQKIQAYLDLKPALRFPHLTSILVRRGALNGETATTIEMELGSNSASSAERLRFRARGVTNLGLRDPSPGGLVVLDVADISSYQWENVNYRVVNIEQDVVISFDCYDFDYETVTSEPMTD